MSQINYEWDIETTDPESGDILDHNHADKLTEFKNLAPGEVVVLVRDVWKDEVELLNRSHWYPAEDAMPIFSNGLDVPKRFIKEFEQWAF